MAIALAQSKALTKTNAAADDQVITLDSPPSDGHILCLAVAVDAAYTTITPDVADSWTLIGGATRAGGFPGVACWWRRAASSDATYSVNMAQDGVIIIAVFSGCLESGDVIDVSATNTSSSSGPLQAADITTTLANTMGVAAFGVDLGATTLSTPTGMTTAASLFGQDAEDITHRVCYQAYASAGATGTKDCTAGASAPGVAVHFALKPAVGGGAALSIPVAMNQYRQRWNRAPEYARRRSGLYAPLNRALVRAA